MLNKDPSKRPSAQEVQNHIWFSETTPIYIYPIEDPNLVQTIEKISKDKLKKKRIRKEKELR